MPSLIGTNPNQVPTNGDLGTMAFQDKESVKIEGGTAVLTGGSINNTPIGGTTPAAGAFTTLSATGVTSHPDGTVSAPAISFTSDPNTGIYRIGADNLGIACNGAKVVDVGTTGLAVTGAVSATTTGKIGTTLAVGNATPAASGAGITFPATQSASSDANTLDDYEEGTWTPIIADSTAGGNQATATTIGRYTKVGRIVHLFASITSINTTGLTGTNQISIQGLPFATANVAGMNNVIRIFTTNITTLAAAPAVATVPNTTYMTLVQQGTSGGTNTTLVSAIASGSGGIYINMSYEAT